ncbi:MAG: VWA domain-containing protein [Acidobacteriota bacterium]|nr:VWA domain-containing protein [Acidobacteriota bacterium]
MTTPLRRSRRGRPAPGLAVLAVLAAGFVLAPRLMAGGMQPPPAAPTAPAQPPAQPAPQPPAQPRAIPGQPPAFRAGVEVVSLNVTVTDQTGHYITDLKRSDFQVYEDGVQQDLSYFDATHLPLALALLLDTSASMQEKLGTVQQAAIGFARHLRPQDLAEVIDFDSRVQVLQPFTSNEQALQQAILQTSAGGSTSLYNAIYIALNELKKVVEAHPDEVRRQAIIVLSDGEDTSSLVSFDEVMDLAKRSETAIYTIGLRTDDPYVSRPGFQEADYVMRQLAEQTGGRSFFPTKLSDLAGVYGQIGDELSSQYRLGYISKNQRRDGTWRRIVVRVSRPDAIVRTKLGYYAPTTSR